MAVSREWATPEEDPTTTVNVQADIGTDFKLLKRVLYTCEQAGYGLIVIVRHSAEMVTVYAHNAKNCVEDGARVVQGAVIALVGQSGGATSPSVHFEVRVGQTAVNPYKHLPE